LRLTGLDVYKLLPRTNCRKCGVDTCLAFAMQVAAGKMSAEQCPDLPEAERQKISAASEPPVKTVKAGSAQFEVVMGGETVLYRHERSFANAPPVFLNVRSVSGGDTALSVLEKAASYRFTRVGQTYRVEGFRLAVTTPEEAKESLQCAERYQMLPMLHCASADVLLGVEHLVRDVRPIIEMADLSALDEFAAVSRTTGAPIVLRAADLGQAEVLTERARTAGISQILLRVDAHNLSEALSNLVGARCAALRERKKPLGYPLVCFLDGAGHEQMLSAVMMIARYASALVIDDIGAERLLPVLTWRHDLYSDPQRPIQVESKLYEVAEPGDASPIYITTNFSLTYYSVETEVSASRIPAYILPVDTDGTSVLTAWAAGKLTAEKVSSAIKAACSGIPMRERKIVIPGHVAQLASALSSTLSLDVIPGPEEASSIPRFADKTFGRGRSR